MKQVLKAGLGAIVGTCLFAGGVYAGDVEQVEDWGYVKEIDDFDDSVSYGYLAATPDKHMFFALCRKQVAFASLRPALTLLTGEKYTVTYRVDKKPAVTGEWDVVQNRGVSINSTDAWAVLEAIAGGKKMAMRLDGKTYRFNISGGDKMVAHLKKHCI